MNRRDKALPCLIVGCKNDFQIVIALFWLDKAMPCLYRSLQKRFTNRYRRMLVRQGNALALLCQKRFTNRYRLMLVRQGDALFPRNNFCMAKH